MIIEMIVKKQNFFEIKINNELQYCSRMEKSKEITGYMKAKGTLTDVDKNVCYTLIPSNKFSVFFGKIRRKYCIFNNSNENCGVIYTLINGFFDSRYIIEHENYKLNCYNISIGKTQNISIYDGEKQVAEIVKSVQLLSNYYIFLLDEYINLKPILSLFVSYFEYEFMHSDRSTGTVGVSYTYDKNNKFYDKNWKHNHFDKEDIELIDKKIENNRK